MGFVIEFDYSKQRRMKAFDKITFLVAGRKRVKKGELKSDMNKERKNTRGGR